MNKSNLYFIALPIEGELSFEVRRIQQQLCDHYGVCRQLRIPPHITLIPPFTASEDYITLMEQRLRSFAAEHSSFAVNVDGIGHFSEKVLYFKVGPSAELSLLQSDLTRVMTEELSFTSTYHYSEYVPHITLANRDMDANQFSLIWPEWSIKGYSFTFVVNKMVIYQHHNNLWVPRSFFALL